LKRLAVALWVFSFGIQPLRFYNSTAICGGQALVAAAAPLGSPPAPSLTPFRFAQGDTPLFTLGNKIPLFLRITQHALSLHFFAKALEQLFLGFTRF
jgi:hypothetical protein